MKPLNYDNSPCSPTSSNCVIWQGPDLDCIKLCKGDTISDVVENLATELCNIINQLNITNYELSCFNLVSCPPETFQELIQFLIDKICEIQNIESNTTTNVSGSCPDCLVSIATCFINDDSGFVNQTMHLIDYVTLIGQTLCNLINEIEVTDLEITNLKSVTTNLQTQINNILPYTLPLITITTPISSYPVNSQVPLDNLLGTFINNVWGPYVGSTGSSSEILAAVYQKTILNSTLQLANGQPFVNKATWISDVIYNSAADAINNIWSVIDDLFFYVSNNNNITVVTSGENATVTSATVGTTTTYTVNSTGLNSFVALMVIDLSYQPLDGSIPLVAPASVTGLGAGQIINRYNDITVNNTNIKATATPGSYVANGSIPTCPFGTFDNATTGEFSITRTGMYLIQGSCNLKADASNTSFWQTTGSGSFGIGLLSSGNNIFSGQYLSTIASINKNINQSTDMLVYIAASSVSPVIVRLSVLNLTDRSYNGNGYAGSDNIRFSITQVK